MLRLLFRFVLIMVLGNLLLRGLRSWWRGKASPTPMKAKPAAKPYNDAQVIDVNFTELPPDKAEAK